MPARFLCYFGRMRRNLSSGEMIGGGRGAGYRPWELCRPGFGWRGGPPQAGLTP